MSSPDKQGDDACASKVTMLLNHSGAGDAQASADLLPLVYERLRALAGRKMRHERSDQTLQATSLVHEAYLRLVEREKAPLWKNRWHFFAAAAESMRRILVENARRKGRIKRGGGRVRVDLQTAALEMDEPSDQIVALDDALTELAKEHPEKAQLVKLRYFGGLTLDEAAQALSVSTSTADRHWAFARAWLYRRMSDPAATH